MSNEWIQDGPLTHHPDGSPSLPRRDIPFDTTAGVHQLLDDYWDGDDRIDDGAALRWRQALLRLSETFMDAAEERRDLSPILLGALHNALEQLLIHGKEDDLMALEEWLGHEAPAPVSHGQEVSGAARAIFLGTERRANSDRRSGERRQEERRTLPTDRRSADDS